MKFIFTIMLFVFSSGGALAQAPTHYCRIISEASRLGEAILVEADGARDCRVGDLLALDARRHEWVARLCDHDRPISFGGSTIYCRLAKRVAPLRSFSTGSALKDIEFRTP